MMNRKPGPSSLFCMDKKKRNRGNGHRKRSIMPSPGVQREDMVEKM